MAYFLNLFSPETYEIFKKTSMNVSGFRQRHTNAASKIHPGDKLVCYLTKLSRWIGVFEVLSESYADTSPLYYDENDPFIIRFQVRPVALLSS